MFGFGKPRNRKRPESRRRRLEWPAIDWRRAALTVLSVSMLGACAGAASWALDQPIERIVLQGQFKRVTTLQVERAVKEALAGKGLVTADLLAVQQRVRSIPWVDGVSIERAWPRGLRVALTEQVPAARWGADGLVNSRGELFVTRARHIPAELPRLSGPDGTAKLVAHRYLATQGRLVEAGMRITSMRLDARGAWEMDLDNGVTVRLGRRQVDERFERFVAAALRLIGQRAAEISFVDMRYTNGFSVGWRNAAGGKNERVATHDGQDEEVSPDA